MSAVFSNFTSTLATCSSTKAVLCRLNCGFFVKEAQRELIAINALPAAVNALVLLINVSIIVVILVILGIPWDAR